MARADYKLRQTGQEVQDAIDKIIALGPATQSIAGTMSAADKTKLDSLSSLRMAVVGNTLVIDPYDARVEGTTLIL